MTNAVVRPSERVIFRRLAKGEGGVLLNLDTAAYHGVNEFGCYLWELLGSGVAVEDLFDTIEQDLQNAPRTWRSQVHTFLSDLEERNLLAIDDFDAADRHAQ